MKLSRQRTPTTVLVLCAFFLQASFVLAEGNSQFPILLAAKDSLDGPPPCGSDGVCNMAACKADPDCPTELQDNTPSTPQPSRPGDIKDCTAQQQDEAGLAVDWLADNWSELENRLESIRGWSVNIGNCLRNRFQKNGKIVCEQSNNGRCDGANAWAASLNRKCHLCPSWLNTVVNISGMENRQACYAALLTHEWAHTCERGHKVAEIIDNETFGYWKENHSPAVTIGLSSCRMD
jgi:hypothetical protein